MIWLLLVLLVVSGLLFLKGLKKSAVAIGAVGLLLLFAPMVLFSIGAFRDTKPKIGEHQPAVPWLPNSASDISYFNNSMLKVYDFAMGEEDFKTYARENSWSLEEIKSEKEISRSLYFVKISSDQQPSFSEDIARFSDGYWYERRQPNGGGITVAYDRLKKRAYIQSSSR